MPWPTRSRRLAAFDGTLTAGPITWMVTVPADRTWLLKDLTVMNWSTTTRAVAVWIDVDGVPFVVAHFTNMPSAAAQSQAGRSLVAHGGESLGVSISAGGRVGVYISGAQLGP